MQSKLIVTISQNVRFQRGRYLYIHLFIYVYKTVYFSLSIYLYMLSKTVYISLSIFIYMYIYKQIFTELLYVYPTFPKEYFKYTIKQLNSQELFYLLNAFPASAIPKEPSVTTTKDV